jgi:hypothetical protein
MKKRGRPPTKKYVPLVIWVMVELRRDRQKAGLARASERDACNRVQKDLADAFKNGRALPFNSIRRIYRRFSKTMKSDRRLEAVAAQWLLRGRMRREAYGWDATPWLFVFDPEDWASVGFNVSIEGRQILAIRPRSAAAE